MTEHSTPFKERVNKAEFPEYCNVIRSPMDLGFIHKKLVYLQYRSKQEFVTDLNLIWSNCLRYNSDPWHPLRPHAVFMSKETKRLASRIPDIVIRDRAEVAAEERRLNRAEIESDSTEESDDEPIMSSKAGKVRGNDTKRDSGTSD